MADNLRRSTRRNKKRAYSVGDLVEIEVSVSRSSCLIIMMACRTVTGLFGGADGPWLTPALLVLVTNFSGRYGWWALHRTHGTPHFQA
jgi:hypothetical protein